MSFHALILLAIAAGAAVFPVEIQGQLGLPAAQGVASASPLSGGSLFKGKPVRVFDGQQTTYVSDVAIDCSAYNAMHVEAFVSGVNPSATLQFLGASAAGGNPLALPDPAATYPSLNQSTAFDFTVGSAFVIAKLSNISGTFQGPNGQGGQGYTVICTPYISPGPTAPSSGRSVQTIANVYSPTANVWTDTGMRIPVGASLLGLLASTSVQGQLDITLGTAANGSNFPSLFNGVLPANGSTPLLTSSALGHGFMSADPTQAGALWFITTAPATAIYITVYYA